MATDEQDRIYIRMILVQIRAMQRVLIARGLTTREDLNRIEDEVAREYRLREPDEKWPALPS